MYNRALANVWSTGSGIKCVEHSKCWWLVALGVLYILNVESPIAGRVGLGRGRAFYVQLSYGIGRYYSAPSIAA